MVTSSKWLASRVTVGLFVVWGWCGVCGTARSVSSAKPTRGERKGLGA